MWTTESTISTLSHLYLSIIYPPIRQSTYPSICWPFPAMPVVRVSVYLPWRPADVYCDGAEYSSNQYGPHQYWISHSGLARCPPAAYSNIVSRIVIIGAELWPSSLQATEYFQRNPKKMFLLPFPYKSVWFQRMWDLDHWGSGEIVEGSESIRSPRTGRGKKGWKDDGKAKTQLGQKQAWKRALIFDTWCSSFFSPLSLSFTLTHTLGSQGNWCAAFDGKERPILTAKKTMMKGLRKKKQNG